MKEWKEELTGWPDLSFGDIYLYLIETPSQYDKKALKAYKSLAAYNYFVSGHVKKVWYHDVSADSPFCFLKADVIPSQRISEKKCPWACLNKTDGSVKCAHCDCMAGLGEACSHIAALLFKIEAAVKLGLTAASSTSKACQWNATYRQSVDPIPLCDLTHLYKGNRTRLVTAAG